MSASRDSSDIANSITRICEYTRIAWPVIPKSCRPSLHDQDQPMHNRRTTVCSLTGLFRDAD